METTSLIYLYEVHRSSFEVWLERQQRQIPHILHRPEGHKHTGRGVDQWTYNWTCIRSIVATDTPPCGIYFILSSFWFSRLCKEAAGLSTVSTLLLQIFLKYVYIFQDVRSCRTHWIFVCPHLFRRERSHSCWDSRWSQTYKCLEYSTK